jgi:hypothetical protein
MGEANPKTAPQGAGMNCYPCVRNRPRHPGPVRDVRGVETGEDYDVRAVPNGGRV